MWYDVPAQAFELLQGLKRAPGYLEFLNQAKLLIPFLCLKYTPNPTNSYIHARGSSPSPGGFSDFPQGAVITSSSETLHLLPFTVSATTDHHSVSSLTCRNLFSTRPSWVVENFKDEMFGK